VNHFAETEFYCRCPNACAGKRGANRLLLIPLNQARDYFDAPLIVTSGNRCPEHNRLEGGADRSEHVWPDGCLGCDVECVSSDARCRLLDAARHAGFTRIGVYPKHLHVGVGDVILPESFPSRVVWVGEYAKGVT